jgi:hypothetical protein
LLWPKSSCTAEQLAYDPGSFAGFLLVIINHENGALATRKQTSRTSKGQEASRINSELTIPSQSRVAAVAWLQPETKIAMNQPTLESSRWLYEILTTRRATVGSAKCYQEMAMLTQQGAECGAKRKEAFLWIYWGFDVLPIAFRAALQFWRKCLMSCPNRPNPCPAKTRELSLP